MANGTDELWCIQCKLGYSGMIKKETFTNEIRFIDSCVQIQNCDTSSPLNDALNIKGRYYNNWGIESVTNGLYI